MDLVKDTMNDQQHHVWCNFQRGPAETCRQCIELKAKYPEIEGDAAGEGLAEKYFPATISLRSKKESGNYVVGGNQH